MKIIIHRGNLEIGASCIEIQSNSGTRLIIDVGMELEGEKACLPNNIDGVNAIFISHAHPDHFGLLSTLKSDIPCYSGEITEAILKAMTCFNSSYGKFDRAFLHYKDRQETIIDDIKITPFLTDHSVADSYAFLIEADGKKVFYSGDFRNTGRKHYCQSNILKSVKNIDALIIEGTCIEGRESAIKTELEVEEEMFNFIKNNDLAASFLMTSSINIDRIISAFKATIRNKKIFVLDIYTAFLLWKMKNFGKKVPEITWDNIKIFSRDALAKHQRNPLHGNQEFLESKEFIDKIYRHSIPITREEIATNPSKYVIKNNMIEPIMKACNIEKANVIYSMWSGYLSPKFDKKEKIKKLSESDKINFTQIHTSGHAMREDLFNFIDKLAPAKLIPFHTNTPEKFLENYENALIGINEIVIIYCVVFGCFLI